MDKNTLWGIICMAAIFFGFMYCQPKAERQPAAATATTTTDTGTQPTDSLDATALTNLAAAVKQLGQIQDDGSAIFADAQFNLKADSTGVHGTVAVADTTVSVSDLKTAGNISTPSIRTAAIKALNGFTAKTLKYKEFAKHLGGENKQTVLENDLFKITIDSRGAMISSVILKKYQSDRGEEPTDIELFHNNSDYYSFTLTTDDQRLETREFNFTPIAESDTSVLMTLNLAGGAEWGIRYSIKPDDYLVSMAIVQKNAGRLLPASTTSIDFNWHQKMARNEKGRTFEERNSAIYYKYVGDSPDDMDANKDDDEQLNGRIKWVAFKNQFFSSVIIPRTHFTSANLNSINIKNDDYLKDMTLAAAVPYNVNDGENSAFDFYFGPNDYPRLSALDETLNAEEDLELTRLIPLGWGLFRYINTWIVIPVFTFLSSKIASYGIIILLLTIFIKLIIFPFTFKSYKSQARMRLLQPEIKQINEKYPGQENAMKRQQETMSLYSRTGASPFSGCLPMLLQMPVLIAMFSFFPSAIELRGQSFLWAHDLSAPDYIVTLPFTIPFYGNGVSLFCLLMTVVNILYMRINMQNQPGGDSMPGMKWMSYLMPVMFLFIFNDYASGLSYYYFLSLLITIVQTWAFRKCMNEEKVRAELLENARKPKKKSGWMARLEEAQRQQQAALRQQQGGKKRR